MKSANVVFLQPKRSRELAHNIAGELSEHTVHFCDIRRLWVRPAFRRWFDIDRQTLRDHLQWHVNRRVRKNPRLFRIPGAKALYKFALPLICRLRYCMLYRTLAPLQPTHVIFNNGNRSPELLVPFITQQLGAKPFFFEAGMIPGSNQCDPRGVNALNTVPRDRAFYTQYATQQQLGSPDIPVLDDKDFFFIPFQVDYDTQIIRHGAWVESMPALLDIVIQLASNCPQHTFVIKEHPLARVKLEQAYSGLLPTNLQFVKDDTQTLIQNSTAVITVNSTVGMEAVVAHKKVIVLGEACYNIPSMVLNANNAAELQQQVVEIANFEPDYAVRQAFIHYLSNGYLIPKQPLAEQAAGFRRQLGLTSVLPTK